MNLIVFILVSIVAVGTASEHNLRPKRQFYQTFVDHDNPSGVECNTSGCVREVKNEKGDTERVNYTFTDVSEFTQDGQPCQCRQKRQFYQVRLNPTGKSGKWSCVDSSCKCVCQDETPTTVATTTTNATEAATTIKPSTGESKSRKKRQFQQTFKTGAIQTNQVCDETGCYGERDDGFGGITKFGPKNSEQEQKVTQPSTAQNVTTAQSNNRKKRSMRAKRSPQFKQTFQRGSVAHNYNCRITGGCNDSISIATTTVPTEATTVPTSTTVATTTTTTAAFIHPATQPNHIYTSAPPVIYSSSQKQQPRAQFKSLNFPSGGSYSYTTQNGKSWNTGVLQSGRKKREVPPPPPMFIQNFEEGSSGTNYDCRVAGSCKIEATTASVKVQTSNEQTVQDPKLYQNFLFGTDNCKQFGNCTTVPTMMASGGGNVEVKNEESAKFYQNFSENSIIQNFDCRNGGCGDLGERLQKMFENLKKSQLKNLPITVPFIYG